MPSFRIAQSGSLEERRKEFQARLEKAGILQLFIKALAAFREKFMNDALPEDPMEFIRKQLCVPKVDSKEIDELREELRDAQEELMAYDDTFRQAYIQEQNDAPFCSDFDTYGIFYVTPQKDDNPFTFIPKVESSLSRSQGYKANSELGSSISGDMKSKFKSGVYYSTLIKDSNDSSTCLKSESPLQKLTSQSFSESEYTGSHSDCGSFKSMNTKPKLRPGVYYSTPIKDSNDSSICLKSESPLQKLNSQSFSESECAGTSHSDCGSFKLVNTKPKLRVPGGPMVESKREECRKMMEKVGILQVLERALASLLMEETFPEDPKNFLLENLQTHSLEFHELRALRREIAIVRKRLDETYKKDDDENEFSDI